MSKNSSHQKKVGPGQVPSLPIDKDGTDNITSISGTSISGEFWNVFIHFHTN